MGVCFVRCSKQAFTVRSQTGLPQVADCLLLRARLFYQRPRSVHDLIWPDIQQLSDIAYGHGVSERIFFGSVSAYELQSVRVLLFLDSQDLDQPHVTGRVAVGATTRGPVKIVDTDDSDLVLLRHGTTDGQ